MFVRLVNSFSEIIPQLHPSTPVSDPFSKGILRAGALDADFRADSINATTIFTGMVILGIILLIWNRFRKHLGHYPANPPSPRGGGDAGGYGMRTLPNRRNGGSTPPVYTPEPQQQPVPNAVPRYNGGGARARQAPAGGGVNPLPNRREGDNTPPVYTPEPEQQPTPNVVPRYNGGGAPATQPSGGGGVNPLPNRREGGSTPPVYTPEPQQQRTGNPVQNQTPARGAIVGGPPANGTGMNALPNSRPAGNRPPPFMPTPARQPGAQQPPGASPASHRRGTPLTTV